MSPRGVLLTALVLTGLIGFGWVFYAAGKANARWWTSLTDDDRAHIVEMTRLLDETEPGDLLETRHGSIRLVYARVAGGCRLSYSPDPADVYALAFSTDQREIYQIVRVIVPDDVDYPEAAKKYILQALSRARSRPRGDE